MDGWWEDIEREITAWLEDHGGGSVTELARHLALSEEATVSLLAVLAPAGAVRICRVEPVPHRMRNRMAPM